ncbi:MAG: 2-(1,2-epoxy-1,2-dihydrophenyl)acetyl-CoA isomerase [Hyphomicrobiaceae bacterium]|jgi:2-(1,2-epoxy-1,2-dihydrophenyl)acetyl-CoA isomerase
MPQDQAGTTSQDLLVDLEDGVLTLTFNRPNARNALTPDMLTGIGDELRKAELNPDVGCVVLTGSGAAFCAGGDVKAMAANHASGSTIDPIVRMETQKISHRNTSLRLYEMSIPTIASIPGPAAGAGFSMALACDMRIAADSAVMTSAFSKIGLSGDYGGTYLLTQLVGTAKARELYYLADRIDMAEAHRLGIVNRVVPAADLQAETKKLAKRIAAGPRLAHRMIKDNMNKALNATFAQCLDNESANLAQLRETEDHKEAAQAFAEKRTPVFKGR